MQNLTLDFSYECELWHEALPDIEDLFELLARKTLEFAGYTNPEIEISVVLGDDEFVQNLNRDYRAKDQPTNVLSFPQYEPDELDKNASFLSLGDVVLAYETLEREASEMNITMRAHCAHLIVHGILHLLGYDHIKDEQAKIMESLEIRILKTFGINNPYETIGFMQ